MSRKILFCLSFVMFLVSCNKNTSEIIFWNYSEEFKKEEISHFTDIKGLRLKNEVLFTISLDNFEYFDSIKKVFKFKNQKKAEEVLSKFCEKYEKDLIPYYCFSIVSKDKIILHGLSRPFPHDVEIYENDDSSLPKLIFDEKNNFRLVYNLKNQPNYYNIEIMDTTEIEKLLPDCNYETPRNIKVIKDNDFYHLIIDDIGVVFSFQAEDKEFKSSNFNSYFSGVNSYINKESNGDYRFSVNVPNYHEFVYICKPGSNDDIAFINDINWNEQEYAIKMLKNGKIENRYKDDSE